MFLILFAHPLWRTVSKKWLTTTKKKYMQFNQTSAFRGTSEHTKIDKLETGNILNFFFT